jgi:hypothetical protein
MFMQVSGQVKRFTVSAIAMVMGLMFVSSAQAGVVLKNEFPGNDPTGDSHIPTVAHASATALARTGLTAVNVPDVFASTGYSSSTTINVNDDYVEFTVTAEPGFEILMESISFKHTRNDHNMSRTGPQNGAVRASFESYAAGSGTGSLFSPVTSETASTWDFNDISTGDGGSATFRFYGWRSLGTQSTNMQLRLDDISVLGEVVPVPEPTSLLGLGVLGMAGLLKRRRPVSA